MFFKSSSSRPGCTFDVFLSFRGEDTRKNFTDHLYAALVQAGIHTFRDDDELPRGEEVSPQLLKAIRESKISIVVFSRGYAFSRWCLNELVEILECMHAIHGRSVLPVFYDIDPSDVRKQLGIFAEAFDRHEERLKEEMEKVKRWRKALEEVGNLSGWNLMDMANGHESKFIQKIVEDVLNKLDQKYLHVAKHAVGIESRVDDIVDLLRIDANNVSILGIYGMAGIGKTTMAKAVFNKLLCNGFEESCFLFNVKEISEKPNGLVLLQEQLLHDILRTNASKITHVHSGINLIKERLRHKRVLVVLDDADQLKQVDALVGERNWFGPGSRIIITTRNKRLLTQLEVEVEYQLLGLHRDLSLQLFSWHAFKDSHPREDFVDLSYCMVDYCRGLPLALEILGSSLFKRSKLEWEGAINKIRKIPDNQIQEKLRISFDSLDDFALKDAFLDIACFFVGWDKEYVAEILDGRGLYAEIGISILVERSLVTINSQNQLDMHDLVRDMGRHIVHEISPYNPGKRSRIWFHEDALDVLDKQMGTEAIDGFALDLRGTGDVNVCTKSFTEMKRLKLLQINGLQLCGSFEHLPKELIWLCWQECPLTSLPSNFQLCNLVVLDMQHSNIKELWKETKVFNKLKILNLSYSEWLTKTPNFHSSSLEKLILKGCLRLAEVRQSIGHLKRLVFLNLERCCRLTCLPESLSDLKSLEILNITKCSKLEKLPDCLGDMESLTELLADETAIKQLPSTIGNLKNLRKLSLGHCNYNQNFQFPSLLSQISSLFSPRSSSSKALLPASFSGLRSLRGLNIGYCDLSDDAFSFDLGSLIFLERLNLSGNKFVNLPSGIGRLRKLQYLWVSACKNLLSISELPSSLEGLYAIDCASMKRVAIQSKAHAEVKLIQCHNLIEIQGLEDMVEWCIDLEECNNLSNDSKETIVQALMFKGEDYHIVLDGGEIPEWFSHCAEGSSVSFQVPAVSDVVLQAIVVWIVCSGRSRFYHLFSDTNIINKSNDTKLFGLNTCVPLHRISANHSLVSYLTLPRILPYGEELELSVKISSCSEAGIKVEKCGLHLIVEKPEVGIEILDESQGAPVIPSPSRSTNARWKCCLIKELQQWNFCGAGTDWQYNRFQ